MAAPVASSGGDELLLAYEEGPASVRQLVMLDLVRVGTPLFGLSAEALARRAAAGYVLDHPHVLRTLRFFADKVGQVLVLEYLGGTTLAESIDAARSTGERWSDDAVLAVGAAACSAMAYAHARGDAVGGGPIGHGAFDAAAVHLAADGSMKIAGLTRTTGTQAADRAAVARLIWELLAARPRVSEGSPLALLRPDLPPEVTALVDAACAADVGTVTLEQLGGWLEKAANLARAREEIARRMSAHGAGRPHPLGPAKDDVPRWAERLRAAREALPRVATGAVLAGACFALGRVSRAPAVPRQAVFAAREESVVGSPRAESALAAPIHSSWPAPRSDGPSVSEREGAVDAGAALGSEAPPATAETASPVGTEGHDAAGGAELGWLTVHSPVRSASVYVHLLRSGGVDETIAVPCGKRLVSLGLPNTKHPEPTWLAPAQVVRVPCGGVVETTIPARGGKRRLR